MNTKNLIFVILILMSIFIVGCGITGHTVDTHYTTCKNVRVPYEVEETYTEQVPYETTETVSVPYEISKKAEWDVEWYTLTGDLKQGGTIGKEKFPGNFHYNWGTGDVYSTYDDYVGFQARAYINIPKSGKYYFKLCSDDGSSLIIQYQEGVINGIGNTGAHKYRCKDLTAELPQGNVQLDLNYKEIEGVAQVEFYTNENVLTWQETEYKTEEKPVVKYKTETKKKKVVKYKTERVCD